MFSLAKRLYHRAMWWYWEFEIVRFENRSIHDAKLRNAVRWLRRNCPDEWKGLYQTLVRKKADRYRKETQQELAS